MTVKAPRTYDSSRRRQQALDTRRRIVDVAYRLFTERGYTGTTMDSVAIEADVAIQTIYSVFGGKRTLLKEMVDIYCGGDELETPALERMLVRKAVAEPIADDHVRLHARNSRQVYERVAPVLRVVRQAAALDPDIASLWEENKAHRRAIDDHLVRALAAKHELRKGLTIRRAVDITSAVMSPEMFDLFVDERGWRPVDWERWVGDVLVSQLLGAQQG